MYSSSVFDTFPVIDLNNGFILRQPKISDASEYFKNYSNPLINRFVPDDCIPATVKHAESDLQYLIDIFVSKQNFSWVIAEESSDCFVGTIGMHDWNRYHNRSEIAYELSPDYWRNGIMKQAISSVLAFAFKTLNICRMQATTVKYNNPSINLLIKSGFVVEGVLGNYKTYKGRSIDIVMFGYTKEKYMKDQKEYKMTYINRNNSLREIFEKQNDRRANINYNYNSKIYKEYPKS